MSIKIDKDVDLPERGAGRPNTYPFGEMEVGDSFFVDGIPKERVRSAANQYGIRHGRKYATRSVDGGIRVWRAQ